MNSSLKFGHRGAKAYSPENTIASVKKALDIGVDGIEIDVHKCASGEVVVFHDFTLDRMTDGSGEIHKRTWEELQELKVKGAHHIPELEEVLDVINKRCIINIELNKITKAYRKNYNSIKCIAQKKVCSFPQTLFNC